MSEGFSREELTAAAAAQQRRTQGTGLTKLTVFDTLPVAPSKEEILAAIEQSGVDSNDAYCAVEQLFADRGL